MGGQAPAMLRFVVTAGLAAVVAFAGCLEAYPTGDEGDDDNTGDQLDEDGNDGDVGGNRSATYVFAWITGNFTAEEGGAGICGWPSEPEVDEEARTITFREAGREEVQERELAELRGLVLLTQWDRSACGVLVTKVDAVWSGEEPTVMIDLLGDVTLGLRLDRQNGSVTLFQDETPEENAIHLEEGESHSANYTGDVDGRTFEADYRLRAMGGWPATGITFADGGSGRPV